VLDDAILMTSVTSPTPREHAEQRAQFQSARILPTDRMVLLI